MQTTTLEILDEVNCRFVGLSAEIRRTLHFRSKIFNPANRFIPSVRLGRWDGAIPYFSIGGETYINLLPSIIEYIIDQNYDIEISDKRTYNREFSFDPVDNNSYSHCCWSEKYQAAGQPVLLRDHQTEAINLFLQNLQGIESLPTGSGKSLITAILSHKVEKYGRSIVIVPNKDLITQTEQYYHLLGLDVGVYYGDRKDFFKTHTICTWQSLEKLRQNPIDIGADEPVTFAQFTQGIVAVVVDECLAPGTKILTPFGERAIETLSPGDTVFSYNEECNEFVVDEVIKLHHNLSTSLEEKMYEIELENGEILRITGNHKVLTQRGWIQSKDLVITDEILHFT